jgi:hypothetical protein
LEAPLTGIWVQRKGSEEESEVQSFSKQTLHCLRYLYRVFSDKKKSLQLSMNKRKKNAFSVSKYVSYCWLVTTNTNWRDRYRNPLEFNVVPNIF